MKDLKLFISSILIIISFFIGILFGKQINQDKIKKIKNEAKYINIDITKSKINIDNQNKNIFISINGKNINEIDFNIKNICN